MNNKFLAQFIIDQKAAEIGDDFWALFHMPFLVLGKYSAVVRKNRLDKSQFRWKIYLEGFGCGVRYFLRILGSKVLLFSALNCREFPRKGHLGPTAANKKWDRQFENLGVFEGELGPASAYPFSGLSTKNTMNFPWDFFDSRSQKFNRLLSSKRGSN